MGRDNDYATTPPLADIAEDVTNVFIYVGDAVRWDYLPDEISNMGLEVKSIASSIFSPTSFSSIVSGTYLPQHGVYGFENTIPDDVPNLLHAPGVRTGFSNSFMELLFDETDSDAHLITSTLDREHDKTEYLNSIEPPFLYMERGPGGHTPYGEWGIDTVPYINSRIDEGRTRFASDYRQGVNQDAGHFLERIEALAERNLLDETLVIYTSDHGELLGENGEVGHNAPFHPNNVYVPMVFVHPDVPNTTIRQNVARHVDILPTVYSALDIETDSDVAPVGRDLTAEKLSSKGFAFVSARKDTPIGEFKHSYESVWGPTGGYVFPKSPQWLRLFIATKRLVKGPRSPLRREQAASNFRYVTRETRCYDAPLFSEADAKQSLVKIKERLSESREDETEEVDKDRLRQLGYIE